MLFTQPNIYHEITAEYCNVLKLLNGYESENQLEIEIFNVNHFQDLKQVMDLDSVKIVVDSTVTCDNLKRTCLKFMSEIIMERLESHFIDQAIVDYFDIIIHILREDDIVLKMDVLDIYQSAIESRVVFIDELPVYLLIKFDEILGLLETLIYEVYNFKLECTEKCRGKLDRICCIILENKIKSCDEFKLRICKYFINKSMENDKICTKIQIKSCDIIVQDEAFTENIFKCNSIEKLVEEHQVIALKLISWKIEKDFEGFIHEKNIRLHYVNNFCASWNRLSDLLMKRLQKQSCDDNCIMMDTLKLLLDIINMLVKLRMKITQNGKINVEFFAEAQFIIFLLSFVSLHLQNCHSPFPHNILVEIWVKVPIFLNVANIELIFHLIAYPFLTLFYKTNNELPLSISGRCDVKEGRMHLKETYKNLALVQENKSSALKNVCEFMTMLESDVTNEINDISRHNLEANFLKIYTDIFTKGSGQLQCIVSTFLFKFYQSK